MNYFQTLSSCLTDIADSLEQAPGPATLDYLSCRLRRKAAEITILGVSDLSLGLNLRYAMAQAASERMCSEMGLLKAAIAEGYISPSAPKSLAETVSE